MWMTFVFQVKNQGSLYPYIYNLTSCNVGMPGSFRRRFLPTDEITLDEGLRTDDVKTICDIVTRLSNNTGQTREVILWTGCVLQRACARGSVRCVRWLLKMFPSCMTGTDEEGFSALESSVRNFSSRQACVSELLLFSGQISQEDLETAYDYLSLYRTDSTSALLLQVFEFETYYFKPY